MLEPESVVNAVDEWLAPSAALRSGRNAELRSAQAFSSIGCVPRALRGAWPCAPTTIARFTDGLGLKAGRFGNY